MVTATKHPSTYEEIQELGRHRLLTAEDLAALPDDGNRYELIGGKLIVSPSPTYRHQYVSFQLSLLLGEYIATHGNAQAVAAPMDVHLSPNDVVQPDLLVVFDDRADIIHERGIMGAPDLVVEILSPSSMRTDFLAKSQLYERFGVREYWIVDPDGETVSVQTLEGDRFVLAGDYARDDTLHSALLQGFECELARIFPAPAGESDSPKETQPTNDE